ncbi:primase alpha helix C-terminal domain-containing protein [Staphylococcus arlettae]|uniref:primase alpha helix C-terminal domain-containing protein n=1 Tax=Staphylococcus arlettae TaxID=29378 RepID=UPI0021D1F108|nr:primase alpha helix C-terminal domain-containing protein [Staphylococcus arlettae]UXU51439.1 primase alpha helix C-terminal domain-containing protein [Staphylococcus arlettae]
MQTPIKLNYNTAVSVVLYQNLKANSCITSDEYSWEKLLKALYQPLVSNDKYERGLIVYGKIKNNYRKDDNIISRGVIALDYDDIHDFKGLYNAICKQLESYSWAFHTTYSHTTDEPRIRLMIPLSENVSDAEYRQYAQAIANHIGYEVDESSYVPSQAMALPVKANENAPYIFKYNDAPLLDIATLKTWASNTTTLKDVNYDVNRFLNGNKQYQKRSDDHWKAIAMGVSKGERNTSLISIIGLLFRCGVPSSIVYGVTYAWAKQCEPPIKDKEFNTSFHSIYKKHFKI